MEGQTQVDAEMEEPMVQVRTDEPMEQAPESRQVEETTEQKPMERSPEKPMEESAEQDDIQPNTPAKDNPKQRVRQRSVEYRTIGGWISFPFPFKVSGDWAEVVESLVPEPVPCALCLVPEPVPWVNL